MGLVSIMACFLTVCQAEAGETKVNLLSREGPYTVANWKADWPGCEFEGGVEEGHLTRVDREGTRFLRLSFVPGEIGPEKNGMGWRWPFPKREKVELRYTVRFSPDFDWVKGGKLPGLCGGPENVSGGRPADGTNGFSARLMWRRDGRGEAYVYHKNQPSKYGETFAFPEDFRFPMDQPVTVRMELAMNTPGQRNGSLKIWIAHSGSGEKLVVNRTDMEWRSVDTFGVDSIYVESFFGGADKSWAPTRPCWAEFGQFSFE